MRASVRYGRTPDRRPRASIRRAPGSDTENLENVLDHATRIAYRFGHPQITPLHITLGIIDGGGGVALIALRRCHVDIYALRASIADGLEDTDADQSQNPELWNALTKDRLGRFQPRCASSFVRGSLQRNAHARNNNWRPTGRDESTTAQIIPGPVSRSVRGHRGRGTVRVADAWFPTLSEAFHCDMTWRIRSAMASGSTGPLVSTSIVGQASAIGLQFSTFHSSSGVRI